MGSGFRRGVGFPLPLAALGTSPASGGGDLAGRGQRGAPAPARSRESDVSAEPPPLPERPPQRGGSPRRAHHYRDALARSRRSSQDLRLPRTRLFAPRPSGARSTASTSASRPGARSGSSANPARANRRSRASSWRWRSRRRAKCGSRGARCSRCLARELKAARAHFQMMFQDPYGSLDPRMTVARIVAEPLPRGLARVRARRARRARGARRGRPRRGGGAEISARILRRPAPAHRHRARADHAAEAGRRRRAGLRARRLDPGAGAESDERPAARRRRHLSADQPRSRRWSAISATRSR